jgi:hypothetical protein
MTFMRLRSTPAQLQGVFCPQACGMVNAGQILPMRRPRDPRRFLYPLISLPFPDKANWHAPRKGLRQLS